LFSGIIEEIATVIGVTDSDEGRALKIKVAEIGSDLQIGHSVSVSGACLTVVELGGEPGNNWFTVEAVHETLRRTTLGALTRGSKVNVERALKFSDRLGGHLVSGHVDAVGKIESIAEEGFSRIVTFATENALAPFFVEKGSVAVEGVSLTVWGLSDVRQPDASDNQNFSFKVAVIPHTLNATTLGELVVGSRVNIETDVVARYVARWLEPSLAKLNPVQTAQRA
jgi:riboflavin synthase